MMKLINATKYLALPIGAFASDKPARYNEKSINSHIVYYFAFKKVICKKSNSALVFKNNAFAQSEKN